MTALYKEASIKILRTGIKRECIDDSIEIRKI
jgi:hypothetical protein